MPFANFKLPAGSLTAEQKELIVHRSTDLLAEIYGEVARPNTMVLIEEVTDGGNWGGPPRPKRALVPVERPCPITGEEPGSGRAPGGSRRRS